MGIQNLLQQLKFATERHTITSFKGARIAIDASSWLYKAAYSCAEELNTPTGEDRCAPQYTRYMVRRCEDLLLNAQVKEVLLVFDGVRVPLKEETNKERREKRTRNLEEGRRLRSMGRHIEANKCFQNCAFTTPAMAFHTESAVLKKWGSSPTSKVRCVFSPFEADAQLVSLVMEGLADAVMSEDSDILVYSVSTNTPLPVIYKFDDKTGECNVIDLGFMMPQSGLPTPNLTPLHGDSSKFGGLLRYMVDREKRFKEGRRMFVQACVLSKCDYVNSLEGIGAGGAFKGIVKEGDRKGEERVNFFLANWEGTKKGKCSSIPEDGSGYSRSSYETLVAKAEAVFFYHKVRKFSGGTASVENIQPLGGEGKPSVERWLGKEDEFMGGDGAKGGKSESAGTLIDNKGAGGWMTKLNATAIGRAAKKEEVKSTKMGSFVGGFNLGEEEEKVTGKTPKRLERKKGKGGFMKGGGKEKKKAYKSAFSTDTLMSRFFSGSSSKSTPSASSTQGTSQTTTMTSTSTVPNSPNSDSDCIDSPITKRGPAAIVDRFRAAQGRGWGDDGMLKKKKKGLGLMDKFGFKTKKANSEGEWTERRTSPRKKRAEETKVTKVEETKEVEETTKVEEKKMIDVINVDSPPRRSPRKCKIGGSENESPNVKKVVKKVVKKKKTLLSMSLERFKFDVKKKRKSGGQGGTKKKARL